MNKNAVVAEQNLDKEQGATARQSRLASVSEVVAAPTRQLRSSRPEVVYHLESKSSKVSVESDASEKVSVSSSLSGAAALVPSAPVASSSKGAQVAFAQPSGTISAPPPQYSAVPVQVPGVSGINVPLPVSPDQQINDGLANVNVDDDDVFELDNIDNIEMAEERTLMPNLFTGKVEDDADEWIRHLDRYNAYRANNEEKSLALFKVLMNGPAAVWLESLPNTATDTMEHMKEAFKQRFQSPQVLKFKSAKEIFSRRQGPTESVDEFYTGIRRLARMINAQDDMVIYALLSGFRAPIANFVTQNKPDTVEKVMEFARMAELTTPGGSVQENQLADQLDDVKVEMRKFAARLDKMSTAAVSGGAPTVAEGRSPSPRRVSFAPEATFGYGQQGGWQRGRGVGQYGRGRMFRGRGYIRQANQQMPGRTGGENWWGQQPRSECGKCGWERHENINLCPAINRTCWICSRGGHIARACRAGGQGLPRRGGASPRFAIPSQQRQQPASYE